MKFPFPTIDEAFLRAAESGPQLTRELFLEQVLSHITNGSLRATGFLFWKKWRPVHIGHYGSDLGISEAFTSSERTEIPPLAMADYRPIFADSEIGEYRNEACQVARGPRVIYEPHASYPKCPVVAITSIDGWTDVRFPADDIERLWANATAEPSATVASRGAYEPGEKVKAVLAECFPNGTPPGRELSNLDLLRRVYAKHAELFKGYPEPHRNAVLKHAGRSMHK